MKTQGLRLEDAPPLWVPLAFFGTAPLALIAAGWLLVVNGEFAISTGFASVTLAIAHLGTLGFLTMVMMGALYQMTAVVAGSPVRRVRIGHAVYALFVTGVVALIGGIAGGSPRAVFWAIALLTPALLLFVIPIVRALLRAPARNETVMGMIAALFSFLVTAVLGLWMAHGHGGMRFPGPRALFIQVHLCVGLLGWVGSLIVAVSWQVLPLFTLSPPVARAARRWVQGLAAAGAFLPVVVLVFFYAGAFGGSDARASQLAAVAALPGFVAVWLIHPLVSIRALRARRRRRSDPSILFWNTALLVAPVCGIASVVAYVATDPRWSVLLGWLALFGWAGMLVHGMLERIVPFLVWLHRFAPRAGEPGVPSARALLPDAWARSNFALHATTLAVGTLAIVFRSDLLARAAGVLLLATGLALFAALANVARSRSTAASAAAAAPLDRLP
jgi:hypothetical protein